MRRAGRRDGEISSGSLDLSRRCDVSAPRGVRTGTWIWPGPRPKRPHPVRDWPGTVGL